LSKKRDDSYFAAGRRKRNKNMIIVAAIAIPVVIIGVVAALLIKPASAQPIDGIECNVNEFNNYHVHAHLDVLIDGKPQQIPQSIGIMSTPSCLYWLHTHTTDGIIHIEAPTAKTFTLGQFLDVWNQTRHDSSVFDSLTSKPVIAYVNGTKVSGDYRDVQLQSRQEIAVVIGNAPNANEIPSRYPSNGPPS
jgi:hypothetical protein